MMRVGWVVTSDAGAVAAAAVRRGMQARGRARLRGRRLFWLVVALGSGWVSA